MEEAIEVSDTLSAEERDVLERFERGELRTAAGADREIQAAREAARRTSNKTKRGNPRRHTK